MLAFCHSTCVPQLRLRNLVSTGRDAKSYAKYNAIDSEVDQRACQDLICGSSAIAEGKRVLFQELVSK